MNKEKILVGNSFPLSLIRRDVKIEMYDIGEFCQKAQFAEIISFWGHRNTLTAVKNALGIDLTPPGDRPVLTLSAKNKPVLDEMEFSECWILSPDYRKNFRPAIGEEVSTDDICNWQCLKITF